MAKKKESFSFEERLEKALIPDWEQPYKALGNWVWTKLPIICKHIKAGGDKPKNISAVKNEVNTIPVVANGISNDGIIGYTDIAKSEKDTITVSARGTVGFSVIRNYEYYPIVRLIVIKAQDKINYKLLKYYFDNFIEEGTGSSIPQLTVPMLADKPFPLPPLAEQQRIVSRIESLFSKLDEAKEKAQTSLDSFENRKDAILHKAFTGELTRRWREENGVSFDSWEDKNFDKLFSAMQNGLSKRRGEGTPTVVLRLANISGNRILTDDLRTVELSEIERSKYCLNENDVLMIRVNGSKENVGKQIFIDSNTNYAFCDHLIRIIYNRQVIEPHFMVYYSRATSYRNYIRNNMVSSAGQNTISRKGMAELHMNLPTPPEQIEIVRILDGIFEKEQKAKELTDVIEKIDLMKKAILARAFRGELGTNDPEEESAMELLKEILSKEEKKEIKPAKKFIVIPNSILKQFKTDLEEQIYRFILENQYATLKQILQCVPSSKQLDAMKTFAVLREKNLIDAKNDFIFTK